MKHSSIRRWTPPVGTVSGVVQADTRARRKCNCAHKACCLDDRPGKRARAGAEAWARAVSPAELSLATRRWPRCLPPACHGAGAQRPDRAATEPVTREVLTGVRTK